MNETKKLLKTSSVQIDEKTEDEQHGDVFENVNQNEKSFVTISTQTDEKTEVDQHEEIFENKEEISRDEYLYDEHKNPLKLNGKMKISWIGTSICNSIDKEQVERNTNSAINITRAYSIN